MTTDPRPPGEARSNTNQRPDIKSIKDALAQTRGNIVVPYSKEMKIGPEEGEYAHLFHRVEIRSFEDLQTLSLIPERLDEKRTLDALASDDALALSAAQNSAQSGARSCGCSAPSSGGHSQRKRSYGADLRSIYEDIRLRQNPQLARLLSEVYRKDVAWDSLVAAHARGWIHRWRLRGGIILTIFVPQDITILNNATLHLSPYLGVVLANDIRIHAGGKLRTHNSYTKIRCASIQGEIP